MSCLFDKTDFSDIEVCLPNYNRTEAKVSNADRQAGLGVYGSLSTKLTTPDGHELSLAEVAQLRVAAETSQVSKFV